MLGQYFSLHPIGGVRYAPQFPPMNDRAAWEGVSPADRDELLALAEAWRNRPYPLLTAGMYAAFVRTGSRRDCEVPYFDRRRKLCFATAFCNILQRVLSPKVILSSSHAPRQ